MSDTIELLVNEFETRKMTRRQLVASLSALMATATAEASAQAPAAPSVSMLAQGRSVNHVSLTVSDVQKATDFYSRLFNIKVVSRPGNGGLNLGLGDGFLGIYGGSNPGTTSHICIGVDDYDPDALAAKCKQMGIAATVNRDPRSRTSGGDQLYVQAFDNYRVQIAAHGYQG
jgi:catechol 2,3-dioxygenase-like lactoylglutathione lyase family enzyme